MAERPYVTLKVKVAGGAEGAAQLDALADAQDKVADATEDAAAAAAKQGDAAAKASGKLSKLWEGLKAGAGAAASASAGIAGMAATLNTDLDEGTKTGIAGLQGLAGVLGAFGPVGQLAATGVSLLAAGLATFGGAAESAGGQVDNFFTRALKDMNEALKTSAMRADEAASKIKQVQQAAATDAELFTGRQLAERDAQKIAQNRARERLANLTAEYQQTEENIRQAERQGQSWVIADKGRAASYAAAQAEMRKLRNEISFVDDFLTSMPTARAAAAPSAASGRAGSGPFIEDDDETGAAQAAAKFAAAAQAMQAEADAKRIADAEAVAGRLIAIRSGIADANRSIARIEADAQAAETARMVAEQEAILDGARQMFGAFAEGLAQAAAASILFGDSFEEVAAAVLKSLATQAGGKAIMEGAEALAALGVYLLNPFNVGALASSKTHALAALTFGAFATGSAVAANSLSSSGGGGGGAAPAPPASFARETERREDPQDREFFINLTSGAGGARPLSRADAGAIAGALVGIFRSGGMRLEAARA